MGFRPLNTRRVSHVWPKSCDCCRKCGWGIMDAPRGPRPIRGGHGSHLRLAQSRIGPPVDGAIVNSNMSQIGVPSGMPPGSLSLGTAHQLLLLVSETPEHQELNMVIEDELDVAQLSKMMTLRAQTSVCSHSCFFLRAADSARSKGSCGHGLTGGEARGDEKDKVMPLRRTAQPGKRGTAGVRRSVARCPPAKSRGSG